MQGIFASWQNQELVDFTQGLYNARSLAMSRMEHEAMAVGAEGIVGVVMVPHVELRTVSSGNSHRIDLIAHFTATGTSIAPDSAIADGKVNFQVYLTS